MATVTERAFARQTSYPMPLFFSTSEVAPLFDQFALHERLLKAVAELKFVEPTPVQVAASPPALEGRDLRVTAQTGSGKTAAFVLPMLNRLMGDAVVRTDVRALILLPTRELAQQTLKEVERFSQFTFIKSAMITGGEDFKRSEEHTSELQSLMRISYAVFCLKKQN